MTPTEKKYNARLGKLYWSGQSTWDQDSQDYKQCFDLVMLTKCERKYIGSGPYTYEVEVLNDKKLSHKYKVDCTYFFILENKLNKWGNGYIPVKTGDLEKDVAQIPKAC
jgi:hypothetical protein